MSNIFGRQQPRVYEIGICRKHFALKPSWTDVASANLIVAVMKRMVIQGNGLHFMVDARCKPLSIISHNSCSIWASKHAAQVSEAVGKKSISHLNSVSNHNSLPWVCSPMTNNYHLKAHGEKIRIHANSSDFVETLPCFVLFCFFHNWFLLINFVLCIKMEANVFLHYAEFQ